MITAEIVISDSDSAQDSREPLPDFQPWVSWRNVPIPGLVFPLVGDSILSIFSCLPCSSSCHLASGSSCPSRHPLCSLPPSMSQLAQEALGQLGTTFSIFDNWFSPGADQGEWLPAHEHPWRPPYSRCVWPWRSMAASQDVGIFVQHLQDRLTCTLDKNRTSWKFQRTFELGWLLSPDLWPSCWRAQHIPRSCSYEGFVWGCLFLGP